MSLITFDTRVMQLAPSKGIIWSIDLAVEEVTEHPTLESVGTSIGTALNVTITTNAFTTVGMSPQFGETVIVLVTNRKGSAADIPTLTGTNGWNTTWTQIATRQTGSSTLSRATMFRGIPVSGTVGTLTATFSANQLQCCIMGVTFTNINQTTDQGVVQSASNAAGTPGGSLSVTLSAFAGSTNPVVMGGVARGTPTSFTPEGTYTEIEAADGVQLNGTALEWLEEPDTTPTGQLVSGTNWAAIAVELMALTSGGAPWLHYAAQMRA